ncbi:MAG: zeta toxin family protein [Candidatus Pacebacteria bacterium]|nr:zeta toxin family protein [Candidatus Paceibacterota bacterium]
MDENKIQKESLSYIKSHKKDLLDFFTQSETNIFETKTNFFMAGSPGAGKTEFVKRLEIIKDEIVIKPFHIDADIIRTEFLKEFYTPTNIKEDIHGNAHFLQEATTKGIEILLDYCFKEKILFMLDVTMGGEFKTAEKNITRCLSKNIEPVIFYLYQDPLVAWDYTKKREKIEGRNILKKNFIQQFFKSRENVNLLKQKYKEKITLNVVVKNFLNQTEKYYPNIQNVDFYVKDDYNKDKLNRELK